MFVDRVSLYKMVCPHCNKEVSIFDTFCSSCKRNMNEYYYSDKDWSYPSKKDKEKKIEDPKALDKQEAGNHYRKYKIQPVEFCQKNNLPYCESNVIKYVVRHRDKNGLEDLKKAKHYLELIAQIEYGESL